jgi:protein-S-isoprenylcysteine O-methyltransferase Ste14
MEGFQLRIFSAVQILAAGLFLWVLARWSTPWNVQRYIGTILALVGITFIAIARYQLGKAFSIKAEAHQLVTRGLYSKIRNPIYVFGVVIGVGLLLVLQQPILWLVIVVMAVGQLIRARREARMLENAFGDAYREYRRKTWF